MENKFEIGDKVFYIKVDSLIPITGVYTVREGKITGFRKCINPLLLDSLKIYGYKYKIFEEEREIEEEIIYKTKKEAELKFIEVYGNVIKEIEEKIEEMRK